jgi:hypothetical protein
MKVTIRDVAALSELQPLQVATYLRTQGWKQVDKVGERGSVWLLELPASATLELLLPLDQQLRDFANRMGEVLRALEIAEERSQLEIITDIVRTMADVVRIPVEGAAVTDGTISVEAGARLVAQTRELMLAAACAALEKRPAYPARKPTQATEYLRKVRLGQTERGSFVLTIQSPVAPSLQRQVILFGEDEEPPFERSVTLTLARALAETRKAAEQASATGNAQPFFDAIRVGVNANLCEAIAAMLADTEVTHVGIRFSWSPTRKVGADVPNFVSFSADAVPVLQEASRLFRESAPRADFELEGIVIQLKRDDITRSGEVTIAGVIDDKMRKVRVELDAQDYERAIEAHKQNSAVRCEGELVREGLTFTLKNARQFVVCEDA